jgi:hypothetical protein
MPMTETETDKPQFRSLAAVLAYEYRDRGIDHLKAVLAALVDGGETNREFVEEAACQLKALRVPIADLVLDAAAQCPSMTDIGFSPYLVPPHTNNAVANQANITSWVWGQQRRAKKKRERCEELLRQAGIDPSWLNGKPRQ